MSNIYYKENVCSKIERTGGFGLGEMVTFFASSKVGKTMIGTDALTPERDYNGPQLELDLDTAEKIAK